MIKHWFILSKGRILERKQGRERVRENKEGETILKEETKNI